jgi:predicted MFS family arabinose efflux permease
VWAAPETSPRHGGWLGALRPRVAVPAPARHLFAVSVPIVLGGWATGGLFLSLGPAIVRSELHVEGPFGQGLVIGLLPATGALAAFVMHNRRSIVSAVYGATALAVGTAVMLVALVLGSLPIYVVAVVIAGSGFGTAFMGTIGTLMPLARPDERAGLFAAIYVVAYLSFGIPAVIAGVLASSVGLHATVLGFGAVVVLAAGTAAVLRARAGRPAVRG